MALEMNSSGDNFELKFGIAQMVAKSCGKCSCALNETSEDTECVLMSPLARWLLSCWKSRGIQRRI